MRIISPLPADCHLEPLINQGITEFYFGQIPYFWRRRYSLLNSINRRTDGKIKLNQGFCLAKSLREV